MPACPEHPGYAHYLCVIMVPPFALTSVLDWILWSLVLERGKTMACLKGTERTNRCSICLVMGNWGVVLEELVFIS